MRSLNLDSNEHRLRTPLSGLQRGGELERVTRHHAIVMIGGGDERCRVARPRLVVVPRGELVGKGKLGGVRRGPLFVGPHAPPVNFALPNMVLTSNRGSRAGKEFGRWS